MKVRERKIAVIMFSDIQGYTSMMQKNEAEGLRKARRYRSLLDQLVIDHNGQILNHYGDGSLTIFDSAVNSISCALAFQKSLLDEASIEKIPVRIGLHDGDIVIDGADIFGNGVNIASRLESLGQPGSILFSQSIYDKIKGHTQFTSTLLGSYHFKNVDVPMNVYALTNDPLVIPDRNSIQGKLEKSKSQRFLGLNQKKIFKSLIPLALLLMAIILTWNPILNRLFKSEKERMLESIQSLVVLPIEDYSGAEGQEY